MNKTRAKRLCTQNEVSSINKNNIEVDRIGSLPDKVLTRILSFLSTKEAVQTCVLSKRWKRTWTAVPILDIQQRDLSGFKDDDCSGEDDEERTMSSTRFERFITGFLDNRAPTNLERVHCVCEFQCSHASMGWLDRVVLLMPLQIHIYISRTGNSIDMPDLVFSCASLQHLFMSNYPDCSPMKTFISPVSVNLPSLKFLELNGIELHDDFAEKFFMGCPSLERLELCGCDLYFTSISSEVLKELTLISCTLYEQMQISYPHLVSLIMTINLKRAGISLKNMSSLVNVDIKLYAYLGKYVPNLDIFGSLSNAAKLELFLGTAVLKESLEKDITNCRNFNNLKKLVVGANWDMSYDFYLIACFLKRSPNLKELVLLLNERQGQRQESRREVSGDVLFQHEYLEAVKIGQAYGYMFDQSKLSREPINAMMKTLGTYVKNIGNIIIT